MKKLTHSTIAKVTAIFLITIDFILLAALSIGIYVMASTGFYISSLDDVRGYFIENIVYEYSYEAFHDYINGTDPVEAFQNKNFYFVITDSLGNELVSNYSGEVTTESFSTSINYGNFYVYSFIDENFEHNDKIAIVSKWISIAYSLRYTAIILEGLSIVFFFILLVFLYFSAGYRSGNNTPALTPIGRIPFDILTFMLFLLILFESYIIDSLYSDWALILAIAFTFIVDFVLILLYTMNFAVRIKLGNLISETVLYSVFKKISDTVKRIFRLLCHIISNLPFVWKTALAIAVIFIFGFFFLNNQLFSSQRIILYVWLFLCFFISGFVLFAALSMRKLQEGCQMIASGNLDYKTDTKYLYGIFKDFANNLNHISTGMQKSVDAKLKSERFKTELITNVSHDIKTPLTSIINYVDLIKKENITDERLLQYIEVLDRQSVRLKKLIEDLVEASKASTGNLPVSFAPCDVGVLLDQAIAEYDDRLKVNKLDLILNKALFPVYIMADGQHLWRVFDNLLNNICKYAQPSTRVYIDLQVIGENAVVTFKNISKYPLNISSEELMERFVRGDSSRNTEGNGLGLSIAKSLVDLQRGTLELMIDGDLFKASLNFKTMKG